jgi:hypothetical protein
MNRPAVKCASLDQGAKRRLALVGVLGAFQVECPPCHVFHRRDNLEIARR